MLPPQPILSWPARRRTAPLNERRPCCADGVSGLSGALAGLAQYYQNKQGKQSDCGLDLGWTHPGAHAVKRSINNTRTCG